MASIANVHNKRAFQRSKDLVTLNLQLFQDMKKSIEETSIPAVTGEAERRKKHRQMQKMKLAKHHVFEG